MLDLFQSNKDSSTITVPIFLKQDSYIQTWPLGKASKAAALGHVLVWALPPIEFTNAHLSFSSYYPIG